MKDLKVVFMGTPEFSAPVLKELIKSTNVIGVVTQPDKEVGRKKILTKSPIKILAEENNVKVLQPKKLRLEYQNIIELNPDVIITCAYGQILPFELLSYPKYNTINVHASLLPKLRGGAPIQHAIMDGYHETGITIMQTDVGMDDGDIISVAKTIIKEEDNFDSLSERLSKMGADLLMKTLPSIIDGTSPRIKQDEEEVTFAYTIKREDEYINFNNSAREVFNKIRALSSIPGAYAILDDKEVKIYESEIGNNLCGENGKIIEIYKDGIGVSTKDGEIIIKKLQFPGKKIMSVKDYLNGVNKDKLLEKSFK